MLKIRLQRTGRKHEPTFRVVLTDSKNSTKSGKYLEVLGSYDPRKNNEQFAGDKIKYWVSKGAKLTDTLHNLLINHKIIEGKKINVLPKKTPPKKDEPEVKAAETAPEVTPAAPVEEKAPDIAEVTEETPTPAPSEATTAEEAPKEETPA